MMIRLMRCHPSTDCAIGTNLSGQPQCEPRRAEIAGYVPAQTYGSSFSVISKLGHGLEGILFMPVRSQMHFEACLLVHSHACRGSRMYREVGLKGMTGRHDFNVPAKAMA